MAKKNDTQHLSPAESFESAQAPLFAGLREDEIEKILSAAESQHHPPGTTLYRQGELSTRIYLVRSGLVRLSQITTGGEDVLIRLAGPGEIFGYAALALNQFQSAASVQVLRPSSLAAWNLRTVLGLLTEIPHLAFNLFTIASHHATFFYNRTLLLQTKPAGQRVAWALAELAQTIGTPSASGVVVVDDGVQRELAELAGTTIFTVSRELGKLERKGILSKERGRILIHLPQKLTRL